MDSTKRATIKMDLRDYIHSDDNLKSDSHMDLDHFNNYLKQYIFHENMESKNTIVLTKNVKGNIINYFINEYWTSRQRQASSIHEISYRACFKPQLPAFFIDQLTNKRDIVYDPFSGRGTTIIEATLSGRIGYANDINPLSQILAEPRLYPPKLKDIETRLSKLNLDKDSESNIDLSMFYHKDTLGEIVSLKNYLIERRFSGQEDLIDKWIRMVATNRLTGHSKGFFSVYTLPPNQATSPSSQIKINEKRKQIPEYRNVKNLIYKKSKQLIKRISNSDLENLNKYGPESIFLTEDARHTKQIGSNLVQLTVTSPPFLDIVQYSNDNWLRCWFNNIDDKMISKNITMSRTIADWENVMSEVFKELYRITRPGGWIAFEVGEVRKGTIKLEEHIIPLGLKAGLSCFGVLINDQKFTKTANIWGINNNEGGTNTNRIVIFYKNNKESPYG